MVGAPMVADGVTAPACSNKRGATFLCFGLLLLQFSVSPFQRLISCHFAGADYFASSLPECLNGVFQLVAVFLVMWMVRLFFTFVVVMLTSPVSIL